MRNHLALITLFSASLVYSQAHASENSQIASVNEDIFHELANIYCKNSRISPGQRWIYLIAEGTTKSSAELSCAKSKIMELIKASHDRTYLTEELEDHLYRRRFNSESDEASSRLLGEGVVGKARTFTKATADEDDSATSIKTVQGFRSIISK